MKKSFHLCVEIDVALAKLAKGENIFTGTPLEAFHDLMDAKNQGKKFYTGCDNMNAEGRCDGHVVEAGQTT
mgnify:CR=1 FL=1